MTGRREHVGSFSNNVGRIKRACFKNFDRCVKIHALPEFMHACDRMAKRVVGLIIGSCGVCYCTCTILSKSISQRSRAILRPSMLSDASKLSLCLSIEAKLSHDLYCRLNSVCAVDAPDRRCVCRLLQASRHQSKHCRMQCYRCSGGYSI